MLFLGQSTAKYVKILSKKPLYPKSKPFLLYSDPKFRLFLFLLQKYAKIYFIFKMSLSIYTYYIIAFIALSGLGIVFFNAESILAICFFTFVALIMHNDPISATLEEQKLGIRSELISCMIDGQKHFINSKKALIYKKLQLIGSLKDIVNVS